MSKLRLIRASLEAALELLDELTPEAAADEAATALAAGRAPWSGGTGPDHTPDGDLDTRRADAGDDMGRPDLDTTPGTRRDWGSRSTPVIDPETGQPRDDLAPR